MKKSRGKAVRRNRLFSEPQQKRFYATLGKLTYRFAQLEAQAYQTFLDYSAMPEKTARAMTGGMRLGNVCSGIKRLAKLRKYDLHSKDELETIINQINAISELRDRLIHRQAKVMPTTIESNNLASYRLLEDLEMVTYTLADINSASLDIEYVCVRLSWPFDKVGLRDAKAINQYERKILVPWLYKPRPLSNPLR